VHRDVNVASRLPASSVQLLSSRLVELAKFIPCEFARNPRSITEVDRRKATEFRQFLLYTGIVVLPRVLSDAVLKHFTLLFVGIMLLISPHFCQKYAKYAQLLLVSFVEETISLYGEDFIVYNIHSLINLADDVKNYGSLDNFSAFPFEK
jgi:hypothetical protein